MTALWTERPRADAGVAGAAVAPVGSADRLPPAPPPFRSRPPLDLEGVSYLLQRALDGQLQTARQQGEAAGEQRREVCLQQRQKAEEALQASLSSGFWAKVAKVFSWVAQVVGVAVAVAAAVVTAAPAAIVVAAALALDKVLEHTGAYERLGVVGRLLAGVLKTAAAADNWIHLGFEAVRQGLEQSGAFEALGRQARIGATIGRVLFTVGGLAGTTSGYARAFATPGGAGALVEGVAQRALGLVQVVSGAGAAVAAVDASRAEECRLEGRGLQLRAEALGRRVAELGEVLVEALQRRGRLLALAGEAEAAHHETRLCLAGLRG